MLTIQVKLTFDSDNDKLQLLDLMRRWSSCMRYAYQRLLGGYDRKTLKRDLQGVFNLNSRYVDDAILKAQSLIKSIKETGVNPKKVIFGGKKLFKKLQKKHLNGVDYQNLKSTWTEKRKFNLYSRGDISKEGNLNLRVVKIDGQYYLRINTGERKYIYANISYGFNNDRFVKHLPLFLLGVIPYTIEIKRRNDQFYAFITVEEKLPEITITRDNGVIGVDLNAYPSHIAWAETDRNGNLLEYGTIPMPELSSGRNNKREYYAWIYTKQLVKIAKGKGKAIVIENLNIKNKGKRGDYSGRKSRRIRHNFAYRKLLEKIKIEALRNGIQVIEVNPAYTSIIGILKYAPQFMVTKDIASAYVIARRGLGRIEKVPKHYRKLFERLTPETLIELKKELSKVIKNKHIKSKRIREINSVIKSLESEPKGDVSPLDGTSEASQGGKKPLNPWRVLKVAVVTPLSPVGVLRDSTLFRSLLCSGRLSSRGLTERGEFLLLGAGTMDAQKPPAEVGHPEMAVTNTSAPELCSFV